MNYSQRDERAREYAECLKKILNLPNSTPYNIGILIETGIYGQ